jgi:hypothetical protein
MRSRSAAYTAATPLADPGCQPEDMDGLRFTGASVLFLVAAYWSSQSHMKSSWRESHRDHDTVREARVYADWCDRYNRHHPQSPLGWLTPTAYAAPDAESALVRP